jgi:hypothetical protein
MGANSDRFIDIGQVPVTAPLLLLDIGHPLRRASAIRNFYQWDSHSMKSHTYSRVRPQIFFGSSYHLLIEQRQSIRLRVVFFQKRVLVDNLEKAVKSVSTCKIIGDPRQELWKEN